ncbi:MULTISPECIES: hypothetical protein [Streptomyces]|uniref:hypothetical protein n=1 Tax=Streptomyces TaxID=1883 RepID=UPI0004BE1498|nr:MULTISPECIES: hypothetical protein [Streptomyces]KJY18185.1 hypothetical protein VR43_26385 [Streptomyces sp. NRRL S-104]KOU83425.1 hypothetical protein ADK93_27130 [Streptomyces sp. XY58]KOV05038.1 hypothetical protein ADK89_20915 [Streptomyces sp. XY37]KOV46342.1 hypothetical protein ADK99_22250 [Streptomyces sp. MMG1064]
MDDHSDEFLLRVRAALAEAGFEPSGPGGDGVHLIRQARGVMIGWWPVEITPAPAVLPPDIDDAAEQPALRHAFRLAVAAALRAAGSAVETRADDGLLVIDPEYTGRM